MSPTPETENVAASAEIEIDSPSKKKRKVCYKRRAGQTVHTNSRGSKNRKWQPHHTSLLIPFLAKLVKKGLKADKNFKKQAYNMAANYINLECGTDYEPEHVVNHFKSLRNRWNDILTCKNMSGAGWNEDTKTITMDPLAFDRWTQV